MFCTFCNAQRIENEAPCPYCGAPSPLLGNSQVGSWGTAGPVTANSGVPGMLSNNQWDNPVPQVPFEASRTTFTPSPREQAEPPSWQQQNPVSAWDAAQPGWGANTALQTPHPQQQAEPSMLPAAYQAPQQDFASPQRQLVPVQNREQMLPARPAEQQGATVYVPPMYTRPRPIIPRYRIISGLLSVLIMTTLACTGSAYYLNTTGKLDFLQRIFSGQPLKNIQATQPRNLPDPPANQLEGKAKNIITSAATASKIDEQKNIVAQENRIFKVGDTIHVVYNVTPPKTGKVVMKFYMNNMYYTSVESKLLNPKDSASGSFSGHTTMRYTTPAEGKVELYWNNDLARTLFFVVR